MLISVNFKELTISNKWLYSPIQQKRLSEGVEIPLR